MRVRTRNFTTLQYATFEGSFFNVFMGKFVFRKYCSIRTKKLLSIKVMVFFDWEVFHFGLKWAKEPQISMYIIALTLSKTPLFM